MYKDKKITFKMQDNQHIDIMMEYEDFKKGGGFEKKSKVIGQIFSPSGTGETYVNAIQVCGLSEAFDFWGCGLFGKPKVREQNKHNFGRKYYYDKDGNKIMEQVKDIQLYFDEDTQKCSLSELDDCHRCFNTPCSCEKPSGTNMETEDWGTGNPYELKRTDDISELQEKKEPKKENEDN